MPATFFAEIVFGGLFLRRRPAPPRPARTFCIAAKMVAPTGKSNAADAARAQSGAAERKAMFAASEAEKDRIRAETASYRLGATDAKFNRTTNAAESQLASATVGLVSREEFVRRRKAIEEAEADAAASASGAAEPDASQPAGKKAAKRDARGGALSFTMDDEDGESEGAAAPRPEKKKKKRPLPAGEGQ